MKKIIFTLTIALCAMSVSSQDRGGMFGTGTVMDFDISDDGNTIVYATQTDRGMSTTLNVLDITKHERHPILTVDKILGLTFPKFSKDGKCVFYYKAKSIMKIDLKSPKASLLYEHSAFLDNLCVGSNDKSIYFCSKNKLYELNVITGESKLILSTDHEISDISNYESGKLLLNIDKGEKLFDLISFSPSNKESSTYTINSPDCRLSSYSYSTREIIHCSGATLYKMNPGTKESVPLYNCVQNRIVWFEVDSEHKLIYFNTLMDMDTLTVIDFQGKVMQTLSLTK